jgi:acetoacetyl-CoA synthetase
VVVGVDGCDYGGKRFDTRATLQEVATVLAPRAVWRLEQLDEIMAPYPAGPLRFPRLPFTHPLFVMFSSGTTGKPKCIVHSAGGTLLQHLKEHRLHCDIRPGDRVFYFTTCGWMMWNWLVSALGSGATLCLYDGSPFYPNAGTLLRYAEEERFTLLGTSARMIDAWRRLNMQAPALPALRSLLSTGSPLGPEGFDYVYAKLKPDLHLASISGGTDIISCFVLGVPTQPVYRGEIQAPGLGMAVELFDAAGQPLADGKGELVCTAPFPSMPTGFWNDPDGRLYRAAYFERFPGVWAHGDFAQWMPNGGIAILGRSDATLNPGGVRIGTAEIYAVLDTLREIDSALCVGQDVGSDTRIVLFVVLAAGAVLDDVLVKQIKTAIRSAASPRHVPARIIAVADLPRTRSGKITELAVREVIHGRPVLNIESLANPESLNLFRDLPALKDQQ